jgi:hypothetical protein
MWNEKCIHIGASGVVAGRLTLISLAMSPGRRGKLESMKAYPPDDSFSLDPLSITGPVVGLLLPRLCKNQSIILNYYYLHNVKTLYTHPINKKELQH